MTGRFGDGIESDNNKPFQQCYRGALFLYLLYIFSHLAFL